MPKVVLNQPWQRQTPPYEVFPKGEQDVTEEEAIALVKAGFATMKDTPGTIEEQVPGDTPKNKAKV